MFRVCSLVVAGTALCPCPQALAFIDLNILGGWQTSLSHLEVSSPEAREYVGTGIPGTRALFQVAVQPHPFLGVVGGLGFNNHAGPVRFRNGSRSIALSDRLFTAELGATQALSKWRFQETLELGLDARSSARLTADTLEEHRPIQQRHALNLRVLRSFWRIGLVGFEGSLYRGRLETSRTESNFTGAGGAFLIGLSL